MSKRTSRLMVAAALAGLGGASVAFAGDVYWDVNGTTAGSGVSTHDPDWTAPDWVGGTTPNNPAIWDPGSTTNWNTDLNGGSGTFSGDVGATNIGNFSAFSDANVPYFIEIPDGVHVTAGGFAVNQGGDVVIAGYGNGGKGGAHGGTSANWVNIGSGTFNIDVATGSRLDFGYSLALPSFAGSATIVVNSGANSGGVFNNVADEITSASFPAGTFTGKYDVRGGTMGVNYGGGTPTMFPDEGSFIPDELKVSNNAVIESYTSSTSAKLPVNCGVTIGTGGATFFLAGRKALDPNFAVTSIAAFNFGSTLTGGSALSRVPITIKSNVWDTTNTTLGASQGGTAAIQLNNSATLYAKWIVTGGELFPQGGDNSLGAIPSFVPDAITLDKDNTNADPRIGGANIMVRSNVTISANRGITLGAGGGGLRPFNAMTTLAPTTLTVSSPITGSGQLRLFLEQNAAARVILTGANDYTGGTWITGAAGTSPQGTLQGTTTSLQGNIINDTGGTLDFDQTTTGSYAGSISGGGAMQKNSAGTVYFTGSNTYTGNTTVNGGALIGNSTSSLPGYNSAGKITVNSGGTIGASAGGAGQWASGDIDTLRTTTTFNVGSSLGINVDSGNSFNYASSITQPIGFVKFGAGILTLSGTNSYSGNTVVTGGALIANSTASLPGYNAAGRVTVASGATVGATAGGTGHWGSADIDTLRTTATFNAGSNLGISVDTGNNFTYGSNITQPIGFTKFGAGALTLSGSNSYTGATTVNGGQLTVTHTFRTSSSMNVADGARAIMAPRTGASANVLQVNTLNLNSTGTLDLNDNDLVVNNGDFATIQNLVFSGYRQSADPSATGIVSSTGQTATGNPILAVVNNALIGSPDYPFGSGQTVSANAVLGKYTYFGDTNLDGQVTADDYGALDANFGTTGVDPGVAWIVGDTNFDGQVTADDYGTLDANFGLGVGNPLGANGLIAANGAAAVPEPAGLAVVLLGLGMMKRKRRRS